MDIEEAIDRFEKQLTAAQAILDSGFGALPGESNTMYVERVEMAQIALAALRRQNPGRWPMTHGDKLRSMTDEEYADFFATLASAIRNETIRALQEKGLLEDVRTVEVPSLAKIGHLAWIREPLEGSKETL